MMTAFAVTTLVKLVTGLRLGGRRLARAMNEYNLSNARRAIAAERELWRRSHWDLEAAKTLRRRLTRHAEVWIWIPAQFPRLFEEHPEYRLLMDQLQRRDQAEIAALDDIVRRSFGGWAPPRISPT